MFYAMVRSWVKTTQWSLSTWLAGGFGEKMPTQWYLNIDHALTLARLKYPALISAYQQTANWMDMSSSEDTLYPSILFNSFGSLYWDPLAHRSLWHLPCATGICVLWFIYQSGTKVMFKGLYQFVYPFKKNSRYKISSMCGSAFFHTSFYKALLWTDVL